MYQDISLQDIKFYQTLTSMVNDGGLPGVRGLLGFVVKSSFYRSENAVNSHRAYDAYDLKEEEKEKRGETNGREGGE